jgi:hypothetical protein
MNIAASNITTTVLNRRRNNGRSYFNMELQFGNGTLTYPAGGIPITAATVGLTTQVDSVNIYDPGLTGYVWNYDQTNKKLRGFQSRISDWVADTGIAPASGAFGTISNLSSFYRQEGDSLRCRGYFTTGTVASGGSIIVLNTAFTIDVTKFSQTDKTQDVGRWTKTLTSGTAAYISETDGWDPIYCVIAQTGQVYMAQKGQSNAFVNVPGSTALASGDGVAYDFTVPCTNLASDSGLSGLNELSGQAIAATTLKCEVIGW